MLLWVFITAFFMCDGKKTEKFLPSYDSNPVRNAFGIKKKYKASSSAIQFRSNGEE